MRRALSLAFCILVSTPLFAATFTVNDLGDASDAAPGNGTCATAGAVCTLRAAIEEANALAGADVIGFSVAGSITPATALPFVTQQLTIDGTTAPGYSAPVVVLDGAASLVQGINFAAGANNSVLRGLKVMGFTAAGVSVSADDVGIYNNYLGPVGGGTPNGDDGLAIFGNRTLVGSNDGVSGNVISGNGRFGILIGIGNGHEIADNYIGTDAAGTAALPNGDDGIRLFANANNVTIGGFAPGAHNVISGNNGDGVEINNANSNTLAANYIGLDATGAAALPNGNGVHLDANANNNSIGSGDSRTYISGNSGAGVWIASGTTNVVRNSVIGLASDGATALPNNNGVFIDDGGNTVESSVISGNTNEGIYIATGVATTTITTTFIGTDVTGLTGVGNGGAGINIATGASAVTISENLISFNALGGITGTGVSTISITANVIGLSGDESVIGNGGDGISLTTTTGASILTNLISGNSGHGIFLDASTAQVISNLIGTDAAGTGDRGNLGYGIVLDDVSNATLTGNTIAFNDLGGLRLEGTTTGTNAGTNNIFSNNGDGISVASTATLNRFVSQIYDNGDLGIDLNADGVTPNDALDADTGANNLQNFPVITSANAAAIGGTIHTTPNTTVELHFFSSPAADPSGFGEGAVDRGTTTVVTDVSGNASFTFNTATTAGLVITATATTASSGTSEFSEAVTILAAPAISFVASDHLVGEEIGTAPITVVRSGDTTGVSTVDYTTASGTATAGADFTTTTGTLTFAPGVVSQNINVTINDDATDEPNETFTIQLSNPIGATLAAPTTANVEIGDNDLPPAISIQDVTLAEGNAGTTSFVFNVTIPTASAFPITVDYTTANDTATAGSDYTATSGTATIPAGSLSTTITVSVLGDVVFESDEAFFVNLTNPTNATILDAQATGTITNDEGLPTILISDVSQSENSGTFAFNVTLSGPSASTVTVDYATADGTATAGSDYAATSGTLTFTPGVTSGTINVTVTNDALNEPGETFTVNLSNPANAAIGDTQAIGTIANDDAPPTILISDVTQPEDAGVFAFTVTLSAASAQPVTVDYATANGTALAGTDYTATTGTLLFNPGQLTATINVPVTADTTGEPNETFFVNLTNPTQATITDAQGVGTITNDDAPAVATQIPTLSEWSLIGLAIMLAGLAVVRAR
jgi:CSLREA domain-containing protein